MRDLRLPTRARKSRTCLGLVLIALVAACSGEPGAPVTNQATPVTVAKVTREDTAVQFEFVGKTQSSRRVEIRSRVEGFLEKIVYKEGSLVQEGDVLFEMDRKPFEAALQAANAELAQQQARLKNTRDNLKRVKPLAEQNAVAQKELDDAQSSYNAAAAAVEAARAKVVQAELELGYCTIRSPVTGTASFAKQREGAYIGFGTQSLLTYVAQIDPMWVEFSVSENQLLTAREEVKKGELKLPGGENFKVEVELADGAIHPHTGRITFADVALSEETGTFLIRATIANPDYSLRPGQFVRARLIGAERPNAILVPKRAVQQGARGSFVWVINAQNKAEFRPINVGAWYEDDWFVTSGLHGNEMVVVEGALKLRAGAPVNVVSPETAGPATGDTRSEAAAKDDKPGAGNKDAGPGPGTKP